MKATHMIAFILLIIGGLNWLLIGIGGWDVVAMIFGGASVVARIIYVLVGLSALFELFTHKKTCRMCSSSASAMPSQTM